MDLTGKAEAVSTRDDLVAYVLALREEMSGNPSKWENITLDAFLAALAGWCADMPGCFHNRGERQPEQPDWSLVAQMLTAAAVYE
jgi:hypothetical protein